MTIFDTLIVERWSKNMFYQRMIRFRAGNIGLICDPVIYTTRNRNLFVHGILVRRFTPCSIPIIHRNTLWLHNSLMVKKILLCRDWTFFRFNFWYGSCSLSRRDDLNGVWNLSYRLSEVKVFWIFHVEKENQKVVRLTTWVIESNSY